VKSPSVSPSFCGICKVRKLLLNLSMIQCWNSTFNAQGSRVIIIVLHVGVVKVKICGIGVEAFMKKERQDETQFTTKIGGKFSLGPNYFIL